jgi:exopolyphosphatase/guanosine-5'-triphosphate,3'-diphosphate pyrophosphatase
MRVLVLDYGSNSLRWLVADRLASAPLGPVESGGRSTRLGRPGEDGRISRGAVEETLLATGEALGRGRELGVGRTVAVATHFARELPGFDDLAAVLRSRWGLDLELLTGEDEAWLTRVGVDEGLRCLGLDGRGYLAADVGGGSTELSWWAGRELLTRSLNLGAIGLTDAFLRSDPPEPEERRALAIRVKAVLNQLPLPERAPVAASGGTATALAALYLGLEEYLPLAIQGTKLERGELAALTARLAGMRRSERRALMPSDERRAEIIVAGSLVLETLLERLDTDGLLVSDYDLKHGAAIALGGDDPSPLPSRG